MSPPNAPLTQVAEAVATRRLVVGAFLAAALLLAVTASRALHRAPTTGATTSGVSR